MRCAISSGVTRALESGCAPVPHTAFHIRNADVVLQAISTHWFKLFKEKGLASSHILEVPHPLVWIVQRARPVLIEAIARQYITGSMWRAYTKGERNFCGIDLPDGLQKDSKLDKLLVTPSTKGILKVSLSHRHQVSPAAQATPSACLPVPSRSSCEDLLPSPSTPCACRDFSAHGSSGNSGRAGAR